MTQEIWKPVVGYEGIYEVSSGGRVRNSKGKILTPHLYGHGYLRIDLFKSSKKKSVAVHRLVAEAFVAKPKGAEVVNHLDECKTNNCVENLEWTTQKKNVNYGSANMKLSESLRRFYKKNPTPKRKQVRCVETQTMYPSISHASKDTGISLQNISSCAHKKRPTAGGYRWEFV